MTTLVAVVTLLALIMVAVAPLERKGALSRGTAELSLALLALLGFRHACADVLVAASAPESVSSQELLLLVITASNVWALSIVLFSRWMHLSRLRRRRIGD
jgi:hypothetical protein